MSTQIRAGTILPARRSDIVLHTGDGLELVGELALPADRDPVATALCLHPLPTHGGMMDSHLLRKAAWRLPALAGVAVLRFNTRGTESRRGRSGGAFDGGEGERHDVAAAVDFCEFEELPAPWLVGWSFGTELALRWGCEPSVRGAVLISPPLKRAGDADLDRWAASGLPLRALVPEFDDYLRPDEARRRFARVPQAEVVPIAAAKHLLVGYADEVLDLVAERIADVATPLPREWQGEYETAPSPVRGAGAGGAPPGRAAGESG